MLVVGCGGSGHSTEAQLATLANGVCRDVESMGMHSRLKAEHAKLRAQLKLHQQLPRVATYIADAEASARSSAALYKLSPAASTLLKDSPRLERKVLSDEKALGWTACAGLVVRLGAH